MYYCLEHKNILQYLIKDTDGNVYVNYIASIENFPGFEDISGYELMDKMKQQAVKLGVKFANDHIVEVDFSNRPFVCSSENGHSYQARAIIVATGSSARRSILSDSVLMIFQILIH